MGPRRLAASSALAVFLSAAVSGCGGGASSSAPPADPDGQDSARSVATVAYVNDGDTLRTTAGQRIRLVQIDAPELHGDCYGKAALAALRLLVPQGARVTLVRDPALDASDRYRRLLRYVVVNGTNVNLALVRAGAASAYFFRGDRGKYANELLDAVNEARSARRGYWGACPNARLNTGLGAITGRG